MNGSNIMINAIISSKHHFSKGITLTIQNGKSTWTVDRNSQKYKYGTCIFGPKSSKKDGILNPNVDIDDFILLIKLIFEFTGCLNGNPDCLEISSEENISRRDVIDHIYNTPLEHKIKFVHVQQCGCNMGRCDEITSISVSEEDHKTYGEVMCILGDRAQFEGGDIYEYPDSVILSLDRITTLPQSIHENSCYGPDQVIIEKLDPEMVYLAWSYGR